MRWNGGKAKDQPLCFIGKGVVFDTGGISIKPAAGMEDMKGDMGGAAAVTGLMHALAARKAKVNAIGIIGLVENMPDGAAQRPGDIVTAMSGKTIEIINTDAEGRLVLADRRRLRRGALQAAVHDRSRDAHRRGHHRARPSPCRALRQRRRARRTRSSPPASRPANWSGACRSAPDYDKLIDSQVRRHEEHRRAGRPVRSPAAQFIKRFVKDTPWAHLDIAGTAMESPQTEINKSWASGWGVRLLDRLVRDKYER